MEDRVLENALEEMARLEAKPPKHLAPDLVERIYKETPGLLPGLG
jgi:hypothetical protein